MSMFRRTLPLATIAGTAVAVGLAVASPGGGATDPSAGPGGSRVAATTSASAASRPWEASARGPLAPQAKRLPVDDRAVLGAGAPAIDGTVQSVQTVADPAGGAPWALRTFERRGPGSGRTWCAQLGRWVDGAFVWIKPGEGAAHRIAATESRSTVCANRPKWMPWADSQGMPWASAPTAGMAVGAMPDRSPDDPAARLAATVAWGVVEGDDARVRINRGGSRERVAVNAHGFLQVRPGTVLPTRATFAYVGPDGKDRTIPADTFPDPTKIAAQAVPSVPSSNGVQAMVRATPQELGLATTDALTQVASLGDVGRSKGQRGLFVRPPRDGKPSCVTPPTAALAGYAVRQVAFTGLVVMDLTDCRPLDPRADRRPVSMGSGWTSTFDERLGPYEPLAVENVKRRIERRLPKSDGGVLIATPRGTRLLEVTSPVDVKTVRVPESRVTWVGWEGQPQVQRALAGDGRGDPNMEYRALDAHGRQLGEVGYAWPPSWANTTQAQRQRHR